MTDVTDMEHGIALYRRIVDDLQKIVQYMTVMMDGKHGIAL